MSRIECAREMEILDAIASGRWPERADAELRSHASSCTICTDVALVAALYRDDYESALEHARMPSAGLVWWKAELRARREAVRVASRPMTLAAGIAGTCVAVAIVALLRGMSIHLDMAALTAFLLNQPLVLWLVLGAIVALTPIALYFVYSDE